MSTRANKIQTLKQIQSGKKTVESLTPEFNYTDDEISMCFYGRPAFDITEYTVDELWKMTRENFNIHLLPNLPRGTKKEQEWLHNATDEELEARIKELIGLEIQKIKEKKAEVSKNTQHAGPQ